MDLTGYSKTQAQKLIKLAKADMVNSGFNWYSNKRIGTVPVQVIEKILGFKINIENDIIKNVESVGVVIDKEKLNDNIQK